MTPPEGERAADPFGFILAGVLLGLVVAMILWGVASGFHSASSHRIVQCEDGRFEVQYFDAFPDWHPIGENNRGRYDTLRDAQEFIHILEDKHEPKVIQP